MWRFVHTSVLILGDSSEIVAITHTSPYIKLKFTQGKIYINTAFVLARLEGKKYTVQVLRRYIQRVCAHLLLICLSEEVGKETFSRIIRQYLCIIKTFADQNK